MPPARPEQHVWILLIAGPTAPFAPVAEYLREAGYTIREANTPDEALAHLRYPGCGLILIDARLEAPDLSKVLATLPFAGPGDRPPVLMAGRDEDGSSVPGPGGAFEADDYLPLPTTRQALLARMGALRRQASLATRLRRTEERYRSLFNRSLDAVYLYDLQGRFLDANQAALDLTGYRREEIPTLNFSSLLTSEQDLHRAQGLIRELLENGQQERPAEYLLARRDGSTVWVEATASLIYDGTRPVAVQGIARDITERKRAAIELENQERRFRSIFENAGIGMAIVDTKTRRILRCNKALADMFGYEMGELCALTVADISHPEDQGRDEALGNEVLAGELQRFRMEKRYRHKSGDWIWGTLTSTVAWDESGEPLFIIGMVEDISERKRLEHDLLRTQRMESIGTLSGGIAHDINNLLVPILMGVDLLETHERDSFNLEVLQRIRLSARRGADLVRQVLSFARGVTGERREVSLAALALEVEAIVANTFPKNIRFHRDIPDTLPSVIGDPTQLSQILLNLCVNARDAMPAGGRLTLTARPIDIDAAYAAMRSGVAAGEFIEITVSDTGCGIPEGKLDRIFEPFFTTKEHGEGTGLGLSTALGIVRSHGGFVDVDSAVNRGSAFRVYLPVTASAEGARAETDDLISLPSGKGETILLVDDEESIRDIVRQTLEACGYRVVIAGDGAEAATAFTRYSGKIDLVITDVMMPVMDGSALIAVLRQIDPSVRIIAASGLSERKTPAESPDLRADHFIPKPFSARTLLERVRLVLDQRTDGKGIGDG